MKRALLAVSFGTSYPDTRRQTIESIEHDLQKAFPDRLFARAWSSFFLRRKVKDREGVSVDSPADALRKLKEQGVEGEYEGIAFLALGRMAGELPEAEPRKENRIFWVE